MEMSWEFSGTQGFANQTPSSYLSKNLRVTDIIHIDNYGSGTHTVSNNDKS